MKTLVVILIIASFLQATVMPLDLVLIVLILRGLIKDDKVSLYLGFAFGLLMSHLLFIPWGLLSIVYVVLVQITMVLARTQLSQSLLTVVPLCFVLLSINLGVLSLVGHQSFQLWPKVIIEALLSLPVYYLIRFWEERFIVKKEIRLKI